MDLFAVNIYLILILILIALPSSLTFGEFAHRVIASLAWGQLTKAARTGLLDIIPSNMTFERLAEWADTVKHYPGYEWSQPIHFADFPDDPPNFCLSKETNLRRPNVVDSTIDYLLKSKKSFDFESVAFMIHLIMDLHHPLHRTPSPLLSSHSLVTSKERGGNTIKLLDTSSPRSKMKSLHCLLDSHIYKRIIVNNFNGSFTRFYRHLQIHTIRHRDDKCLQFLTTSNIKKCIWRWAIQTNFENCLWVWKLPIDGLAESYISTHRHHSLSLLVRTAYRTAKVLNLLFHK
jgi:hypothetical protein